MDELFTDANVKKIAIIDDDLANKISIDDLRKADTNSYADILEDLTDEDFISYVELLSAKGKPFERLEDRVEGLSNSDIRSDAPESLRNLANAAIQKREDAVAPVKNVIRWIKEYGFPEENISLYSSFEAFQPNSKSYDLILVDYLLAEDSEESTKSLIRHCLAHDSQQEYPQIFILMSSYEDKLIENFQLLREEFGTTGSRFRILKKPLNEGADKAEWLHTIDQVCNERTLVRIIEKFITEWGGQFQEAVNTLSSGLWGLDAHGLDLLRRTANEDHVTFSAYFSELIMRRVLAEIESKSQPSKIASELEEQFSKFNSEHPISPGSEVSDSREYLRKLLGDVNWHREEWFKASSYPIVSRHPLEQEDDIKKLQFEWVRNNLGFGSVLRNKETNQVLIHLTQTCDLAHSNFDGRQDIHLLLFPGTLKSVDSSKVNTSEALSPGVFLDGKWNSIVWNLHRPITPALGDFQSLFEKMEIVGQLRSDQAQQVAAKYAAKVSRVGTLRVPLFTELEGRLLKLTEKEIEGEDKGLEWGMIGDPFKSHLLTYEEKKYVVNFSSEDSAFLAKHFVDENDVAEIANTTRHMMGGVQLTGSRQAKVFSRGQRDKNDLIVLDYSIDTGELQKDHHGYFNQFQEISKVVKPENVDKTFMVMYKI